MKKNVPSVTVLIPALNEENTIGEMVRDCLRLSQYNIEVLVVVDPNTTDDTAKRAVRSKAKVLCPKNIGGKGTNVREAIPYISGDYVIQIDADYQFLPREIPRLISPLLKSYDVTLGTRYEKGANVEQGSVSRLKLWGSYILSLATSLFSGQRITDVMCGFKGFKRSVLEELSPRVDHFGYEAELVIKAAKQNYKILNVPITYRKRISGKSNVHLIKHGILVLYTIFKYGLSTKRILQRNNLTLHANKYQRK